MKFQNNTGKDVVYPKLDLEFPLRPPIHLTVKVGDIVDLPEKVGMDFGFSTVGKIKALTEDFLPSPKTRSKVSESDSKEEE